jgi:uncharacterized repeat protein (TIGR03803 family)
MGQKATRNQIDRIPNRASGLINTKGSETMTQGYLLSNWLRGSSAAVILLACSTFLPAQTPSVSVLVNFTGANGAAPASTLIQATNGEYYGTTDQGGTNSAGTVFDVTSQGSLTTLSSLCCQSNYVVGVAPGTLTQTADGVLYGTTALGGLVQCQIDIGQTGGCGTIFQVSLAGELTTLYNFSGPDGASPGAWCRTRTETCTDRRRSAVLTTSCHLQMATARSSNSSLDSA